MCERIYFPEEERLGDIITIIDTFDESVTASDYNADNMAVLAHIIPNDEGVTTVISETPISGTIYRYGNHGQFWEKIGKTCGYA